MDSVKIEYEDRLSKTTRLIVKKNFTFNGKIFNI